IAVLLDELEWIGGPVFAARLHNVQVADEQDGFLLSRAAVARDKVLLAIDRTGNADILRGETGGQQATSHGFGGSCDVAHGIGRIDLDELFEDGAGLTVHGLAILGARRMYEEQGGTQSHGAPKHAMHSYLLYGSESKRTRVRRQIPRSCRHSRSPLD